MPQQTFTHVPRIGKHIERQSRPTREAPQIEAGLERRSVALANRLTNLFRNRSRPFPLTALLEYFEIREVRERPLDRDACLRVAPPGFLIEVNSLYPLTVQRLGIAHEIGHLVVERCIRRGQSSLGKHSDPRIEGVCDRVGRLLLTPDWALCFYLRRYHAPRSATKARNAKPTIASAARAFGIPHKAMTLRVGASRFKNAFRIGLGEQGRNRA
jgi:hypothetical protein